MNRRLLAANWLNVALNVGLIGMNLWHGHYGITSWNSVVVVAFLAWIQIHPKLHARLDAQIGEAAARCRMADVALAAMEASVRAGDYQVSVTREDGRVN
jgi:hypothetical protein